MSKVHLVHGAFNKNASGWEDLSSEIVAAGLEPAVYDYGWVGPVTTRRRSREAGADLAAKVGADEHVVTFSNGGLVAWEALDAGMECDRMVLVMPALAKDVSFPAGVNKVYVLYNRFDWAVELSRFWSWLNPFGWTEGGWGAMGRQGPTTGDGRVEAIDTEQENGSRGHLGWRRTDAEYWMPRIVELLEGDE